MRRKVNGQALFEGLIMLGFIAVLLTAVGHLGRYADLRMTAEHQLQYQLFDQARAPASALLGGGSVNKPLSGLAPWRDRRGKAWLTQHSKSLEIHATAETAESVGSALAAAWQASLLDASAIRLDLHQTVDLDAGLDWGRFIPLPGLALQRSVYRGTGYALNESEASSRLSASRPIWSERQARHRGNFLLTASRLRGVDAGWSRPAPGFDWIRPTETLVPEDRLRWGRP